MGFGILFIGYLLTLPVFASFYYTVPAAAVLLAIGCFKLARVNRPFGYGSHIACLLFPASLAAVILRLINTTEWLAPYFETLCMLIFLIWHLFVLTGMEWVAEETGLRTLRAKAFRNKIFICIYLLPAMALNLIDNTGMSAEAISILHGMYIAIVLVGLVVLCLNLLLIYTAYMRICMPEDLNMPRKPSRFAFVNRRREEADRREAQSAEAWQASRAARLKAKEEKRNRRRNNK